MATQVLLIPTTPGVPYYSQRTRLDGRDYILRFAWNQREERWYLTIADEDDQVILSNIKLLTQWPLLRYHLHDPRVPPGELIVQTLTQDLSPPGLHDFGPGLRCELNYYATT